MRKTVLPALGLSLTLVGTAAAQHEGHGQQDRSPYADHVEREIKALAPEEMEGLLAGEGLGMALAAELNGWPGPRHVLELEEELGLEPEQRSALQRIFAEMNDRATALGEEIVGLERELDRSFADGPIDAARVERLTRRIGELRGRLRAVHLVAHLETRALLDAEQVREYARLRGYSDGHRP
jgi:hypothetical protein